MALFCEGSKGRTWQGVDYRGAGLRPRAADELPVLGKTGETDGLFFATGHYRNGILLAPLTGELIAALIADNVVAAELQTFTPDRFATVSVN